MLKPFSFKASCASRYTNADLKVSLYVWANIRIISKKNYVLNPSEGCYNEHIVIPVAVKVNQFSFSIISKSWNLLKIPRHWTIASILSLSWLQTTKACHFKIGKSCFVLLLVTRFHLSISYLNDRIFKGPYTLCDTNMSYREAFFLNFNTSV